MIGFSQIIVLAGSWWWRWLRLLIFVLNKKAVNISVLQTAGSKFDPIMIKLVSKNSKQLDSTKFDMCVCVSLLMRMIHVRAKVNKMLRKFKNTIYLSPIRGSHIFIQTETFTFIDQKLSNILYSTGMSRLYYFLPFIIEFTYHNEFEFFISKKVVIFPSKYINWTDVYSTIPNWM